MPVLHAAYIFAVYITIKSSRDVIENGSAAFGSIDFGCFRNRPDADHECLPGSDRLKSAFAIKCIAFCITAAAGIITGNINGGSSTFTVFVVSAVVRFTVDIDGFASTAGVHCVLCRTFILASETFTGCIISVAGFCTLYADGTFGTERILVIIAVVCGTF